MRLLGIVIVAALMSACGGTAAPVTIETGRDVCRQCGKAVADARLAAQIVAPGEDPAIFDDIGCMVDHLSRNMRQPQGAMAYVADHQTGEWVPAVTALYTRNLQVPTPASSHLIAHASIATQEVDPAVKGGARVSVRDLSPLDLPDGTR